MRRINVSYPDRESFLDAYFPNGGLGGILVDSSADLPLGEDVELSLRFEKEIHRPFKVHGRVAWRRLRGNGTLKAGLGVEFASTERAARDQLIEFARGNPVMIVDRAHERVRTQLKVKVAAKFGSAYTERLGDISEGGVFIRSQLVIPVGETLNMAIRPPFSLRKIRISGRVTWHRPAPLRGMGVQFRFDSQTQRTQIEQLVKTLTTAQRKGRGARS